ncbi:hypothetical protein [Tessaracoccus caeni]|uniref:hypothetical protein n=1 Tax=Tessaracoccus caeni TaxID=3031239 RepID=UPI0023DA18C0|nr:hypothetical protein [Tessaracoccus caeni]MDF1488307.1 hypothetical protein [Tessaracoccus caeni]
MLKRSSLKYLSIASAAALAAGVAFTTLPAQAAPPESAGECVDAGLVWVHVEFDDLYGGACAENFGTAEEALLDTGLLEAPGSYITKIGDREAEEREWWSVYTLAPGDDGTYAGDWAFAEVGADTLTLTAGDVLGLVLQEDWDKFEETHPPLVNPFEDEWPEPSPEPSESADPEPSETPSATSSPSATSKPTPTPSSKPTTKPGLPKTGN